MKKGVRVFIVLTLILALSIPVIAYAESYNQNIWRNGNYVIVDTVTARNTSNGILVETIERKWIPESQYNSENPTQPYNPGQTKGSIKDLSKSSLADLQSHAYLYSWTSSVVENEISDSKIVRTVTFMSDESGTADLYSCTFTQVATYDSGGYPIVRYYIGSQDYTVGSIKQMFEKYGRRR